MKILLMALLLGAITSISALRDYRVARKTAQPRS
jgi:hypothetical protein